MTMSKNHPVSHWHRSIPLTESFKSDPRSATRRRISPTPRQFLPLLSLIKHQANPEEKRSFCDLRRQLLGPISSRRGSCSRGKSCCRANRKRSRWQEAQTTKHAQRKQDASEILPSRLQRLRQQIWAIDIQQFFEHLASSMRVRPNRIGQKRVRKKLGIL